jgi:hypothetical protein
MIFVHRLMKLSLKHPVLLMHDHPIKDKISVRLKSILLVIHLISIIVQVELRRYQDYQ